jgi:hypothetical protein
MCYRISFFLSSFLKQEHQVNAEPVVGYVNDGTKDFMISHAWVEFSGRKIDLGLTATEHPDVQLEGPLLILDRSITQGKASYTYHRERSAAAHAQVQKLMALPAYKEMLAANEAEHAPMAAVAESPSLIRTYLDTAPDGLGYERLAQRVRTN